jgi:hypothetical protein
MRFLVVGLFILCHTAVAQKVAIRGVLRDSSGTAMPSATIMLLSAQDSVLVNFSSTDATGLFEMKNVLPKKYLLKVTYVGFAPLVQAIDAEGRSGVYDIGELELKPHSQKLDEITITAEKPPVVVKRDTIEFNADSFKPRESSTVEDLLKKLPGVEVDNDGTIRAQGEKVQRMTVDGKNFFGSDPKIASKNLPADVVSKVQVYDRKSDQAVFSGIDDGQREKTINLELKEEKRKGAFGILNGGVGNDNRFQAKASINKFSKTRQLSFLAMANNVNQQGFGIEEYMNFSGNSQQMMTGGQVRIEIGEENNNGVPLSFGNRPNGLMSSYAGGINYNQDVSKKTEVNSSYFFSQLDHNIDSDLERINYLPDGSENIYTQKARQHNTSYMHRGYAMIDHKVDSMNSLKFTTTAAYNETRSDQESASETYNESDLLNNNLRQVNQDGINASLNATLLWRHKFSKKGRTFSTNAQLIAGDSRKDGALASVLGNGTESNNVLQNSHQDVNNLTYAATLSYTEPLGKRKYLEGNLSFRENRNSVTNNVFDVETGIETPNDLLSSAYTSSYQYKRGGINFRSVKRNYNLLAGVSLQQTDLEGLIELQDIPIQKSFTNFLPSLRFAYDFSNTKHLNLDIETSVQEPSIRQLQPIIDNSDPVNLYTGNPDLRPAYSNNIRLHFRGMNPISFMNFFAFVEARLTKNAITTAQAWTVNGIRILRPENVESNQRYMGDFNFGFPITAITSRVSLGGNLTNERGYTVINSSSNKVEQNVLGASLRYDYHYREIVNIGLAFKSSRQSQQYKTEGSMNQLFFNNTLAADAVVNFLKDFTFGGSLEYLYYLNKTLDQRQQIPLVDLSLSRYMLKGRNGELKFGVYNLLDRNIGISQTASLNYYERQQFNNLGRYFMLSFTYSLNKQINPMSGPRPGGRMIRIMN